MYVIVTVTVAHCVIYVTRNRRKNETETDKFGYSLFVSCSLYTHIRGNICNTVENLPVCLMAAAPVFFLTFFFLVANS